MQRKFTHAGGFFLAGGIIAGFIYGLAAGDPVKWSLLGTAFGIGIAVLLWLLDRTR